MIRFSSLLLLFLLGITACSSPTATVQPPTAQAAVPEAVPITVRGEELHYVERGTGRAVIFVHGTLGDYRTWQSHIGPYSEDYHVVSYSRRYAWPNEQTFDESADYSVRVHADDLYAMVQQLGLEEVDLVGHSYGAFTALTMALDHPDLVRSLTLGEPPAASLVENSEPGGEHFEAFLRENLRPSARAFRADSNELGLELFLRGVMGPDFRLDQMPAEAKGNWMDNLLELWGAALNESFLELDRSALAALDIPVLLMVGAHSPIWLVEVSKELNQLLPNSQLVTISNSSHGLYFENPDEVNGVVSAFLEKN